MKIIFNIKYDTIWGQKLLITGSCTELGANNIHAAKEMHYHDRGEWLLEINLPDSLKELKYNYIVENENGIRKSERQNLTHHISFENKCDSYFLYDYWLSESADRTFYTSAFTGNLFARQDKKDTTNHIGNPEISNKIILRLKAPNITPGQAVAVTGNQSCLGNWNINHAIFLSDTGFPQWEVMLHT
jgi:4-alpha-glucanotransferase